MTTAGDLRSERGRLLGLLAQRAERASRWVHPWRRVPWAVIKDSVEAHLRECADMLWARPARGACSSDDLRIAMETELGRAKAQGSAKAARSRLRDLFIITRALRGLGEGLRFDELLAATNLREARLGTVLHWAQRCNVLRDEGERGWFFPGSDEHRARLRHQGKAVRA